MAAGTEALGAATSVAVLIIDMYSYSMSGNIMHHLDMGQVESAKVRAQGTLKNTIIS
jgi:hypothetical protein